ncbi:hypothetical protein Lepto7375DRAFT_7295 [Leptolyngbya sp. PCC 7375]|nr:hypothetical protein Lepto7375DRAFT_7295 [Leptolyngbya sp. PCC 7375]
MAYWKNWNPPTIEKPIARLEWATDYASLVHEGAEDDEFIYPGRPWTDYAVAELDFENIFANKLGNDFNLQGAFVATVNVFIDLCEEAMTSPVWFWPRTTYRYNGDVVPPGERDIYDTGELFDSLIVEYLGGVS